jgi:hypothetical protein
MAMRLRTGRRYAGWWATSRRASVGRGEGDVRAGVGVRLLVGWAAVWAWPSTSWAASCTSARRDPRRSGAARASGLVSHVRCAGIGSWVDDGPRAGERGRRASTGSSASTGEGRGVLGQQRAWDSGRAPPTSRRWGPVRVWRASVPAVQGCITNGRCVSSCPRSTSSRCLARRGASSAVWDGARMAVWAVHVWWVGIGNSGRRPLCCTQSPFPSMAWFGLDLHVWAAAAWLGSRRRRVLPRGWPRGIGGPGWAGSWAWFGGAHVAAAAGGRRLRDGGAGHVGRGLGGLGQGWWWWWAARCSWARITWGPTSAKRHAFLDDCGAGAHGQRRCQACSGRVGLDGLRGADDAHGRLGRRASPGAAATALGLGSSCASPEAGWAGWSAPALTLLHTRSRS